MDQSISKNQTTGSLACKKIAFIQAGWHEHIVSQAYSSFKQECAESGITDAQIDLFTVPGSLEIPLQAKLLAKSQNYAIIVAAGLIVDGGIYRHDFVAASVIDAIMQIQLETEVPILSVVLTPHHFQETLAHDAFFIEHFKLKGGEAARACIQTLKNLEALVQAA